ncbi:MAG: DUF4153 domain-containing protein, partial [Dysgonamonadaceae bacterium]|nr:DUF4153 domain-containing protein [Dysgonamonadaceae bacterium]
MKFFSFASLGNKFLNLAKRMPVSVLMVCGFAVLLLFEINDWCSKVPFNDWVFFSVGVFISVALTLWVEDFVHNRWKHHALALAGVALWYLYCLFLPADDSNVHFADGLQIAVLGATAFAACFFIAFLRKNQDRQFWSFCVQTLFQLALAYLFGLILFAGLALAVVAIDTLFDIHIESKVYGNLAVLCFALFAPLYCLSNITQQSDKHQQEMPFNKLLKILGLYILTPLMVVYAVILYAYLARIIVAWELPNGWVSWLVSVLSLGTLLIIALLYPLHIAGKNKTVRFISRYSGILLFPLLVLMSIGIGRRISDYGISINRCYVLLLNVWFYGIYAYLFISKAKHIKWILISPVVLALLVSIGPWSFSSVTKRSLLHKMENLLNTRQLNTDSVA